MTVLANALSAADTVMNLGSALDVGNFPAPYTIGSEAILVTGGDNTTSPSIIRGQNGTASAAHAAGTSLTSGWGGGSGAISATDGSTTVNPATTLQFPGGTLTDLGSGTAGVGLVLQQIGPFRFHFDDSGAASSFHPLASLAAGTVVLRAWAVLREVFSVTDEYITLAVGHTADMSDGLSLINYRATLAGDIPAPSDPTSPEIYHDMTGANIAQPSVVVVANADTSLGAGVGHNGNTTGQADVYAIIATPAS